MCEIVYPLKLHGGPTDYDRSSFGQTIGQTHIVQIVGYI